MCAEVRVKKLIMKAYRINTAVDADGTVQLNALPFRKGEQVEIIILPRTGQTKLKTSSIQGKVMEYSDPTAPVAEDDWEELH